MRGSAISPVDVFRDKCDGGKLRISLCLRSDGSFNAILLPRYSLYEFVMNYSELPGVTKLSI